MYNKKSIFLIIFLTALIFIFNELRHYISAPSSNSPVQSQKASLYDFPLIKSDSDARGGDISISQNENGLVINGIIDGNKAKWPKEINDNFALYDHVELWLADISDTKLPPIGWGNQFGNPTLASEKDCDGYDENQVLPPIDNKDACKKWFRDQIIFRPDFKKLFVRQWQMAPNLVKEVYASTTYSNFPSYIQEELKILKPIKDPSVRFIDNGDKGGYTFEINIPWHALPPINSLTLKNLKLNVDVFNQSIKQPNNKVYSSIVGSHQYGDLSLYKVFTLTEPRQYYITSCKYDLGDHYNYDEPVFSEQAVSYIIPSQNLNINKTIKIDNNIQGYQYGPDASSTSPTVYDLVYFEKDINNKEIICGPQLAYVKDSQITKVYQSAYDNLQPTIGSVVQSKHLDLKYLNENEILIKSGPEASYSYYGSGQCGACDRVSFSMTYIDLKNSTSTTAFFHYSIIDENDVDFKVSSNWKKITQYEYGPNKNTTNLYDSSAYSWTSTDYCLNNQTHIYDECGKNNNAIAPQLRTFSRLRIP